MNNLMHKMNQGIRDIIFISKRAPFFYIPVPKREKQEFLNRVKKRVEFYKPKIEEKTGINLGEINVREYPKIMEILNGGWKTYLEENPELNNSELKYKINKMMINSIIYIPLRLFLMVSEEISDMGYRNSNVYVPFGFASKFEIYGIGNGVDKSVVHELSHHLWKKIDEKSESIAPKIWREGFASYCHLDYFKDLYPEGYKLNYNLMPSYSKGRQKMKKLVRKYREDIVLEVPKRWKEFDKELKTSFLNS